VTQDTRRPLRLLALGAGLSIALAACATKPAAAPTPPPTPAASATPKPPHRNPTGPVNDATLKQYRAWINEARVKHPYADSADRMYAVMMCESRGQTTIVNPFGPYKGLFQYGGPTWNDKWNTYRDNDILDAKSQIFATALAWSLKMQSHWGCYKKTS
jgi:hypothetical protein